MGAPNYGPFPLMTVTGMGDPFVIDLEREDRKVARAMEIAEVNLWEAESVDTDD